MLFEESESDRVDWGFLVFDAIPVDNDDEGSLRQIEAEHVLYESIEKYIDKDLALLWEEVSTSERMTLEESLRWVHRQLVEKGYITPQKPFQFNTDDDVHRYLKWLKTNNLLFHFDDDPKDCLRNARLEFDVLDSIVVSHAALWSFTDPWRDEFSYIYSESLEN